MGILECKVGCSIITHDNLLKTFEKYKFLRMLFGLGKIQDIFQRKIDQTYQRSRDAVGIADDEHIFCNDQTHYYNVHKVKEHT